MLIITPASGTIGADIHGVDLSQLLGTALAGHIRQALLDHQVLFFREQPILTFEQHSAVARSFGELEVTPFRNDDRPPTLLMIEQFDAGLHAPGQGANFHADNTFRPYPPMGGILQAQVLPERGGDTCFASMYAAYEALSAPMRSYLDKLEAWHSLEQMKARLAVKLRLDLDQWPPIKHPVIAVHPETGRRLLNVNINWTTHIDAIPHPESTAILAYLYEHVKRPEFQVRLRWNVGDVAFWDNRCVQHCGVADYRGRRLMQRLAVAGEPALAVRALGEAEMAA